MHQLSCQIHPVQNPQIPSRVESGNINARHMAEIEKILLKLREKLGKDDWLVQTYADSGRIKTLYFRVHYEKAPLAFTEDQKKLVMEAMYAIFKIVQHNSNLRMSYLENPIRSKRDLDDLDNLRRFTAYQRDQHILEVEDISSVMRP